MFHKLILKTLQISENYATTQLFFLMAMSSSPEGI
jgi:hypothetical protein